MIVLLFVHLQAACIAVTILLHYFFLAAFCWMLCEGIIIYLLLVKVFYNGFFKSMLFFSAMGWGMNEDSYCAQYYVIVKMYIQCNGDITLTYSSYVHTFMTTTTTHVAIIQCYIRYVATTIWSISQQIQTRCNTQG